VAAKKIAVKLQGNPPDTEDLVLGAEAIPSGCRFDTTQKKGASTPEKKSAITVG
jgi:hypothetical protein